MLLVEQNLQPLLGDNGGLGARSAEILAKTYASNGLLEDALYYYRKLGSDYANVTVDNGRKGSDLLNAIASDADASVALTTRDVLDRFDALRKGEIDKEVYVLRRLHAARGQDRALVPGQTPERRAHAVTPGIQRREALVIRVPRLVLVAEDADAAAAREQPELLMLPVPDVRIHPRRWDQRVVLLVAQQHGIALPPDVRSLVGNQQVRIGEDHLRPALVMLGNAGLPDIVWHDGDLEAHPTMGRYVANNRHGARPLDEAEAFVHDPTQFTILAPLNRLRDLRDDLTGRAGGGV